MSNATEETQKEIRDLLLGTGDIGANPGQQVTIGPTQYQSDEGPTWFRLSDGSSQTGVAVNPLFVMSPSPLVDSDAGTVTKKLVLTGARKLRGFIVANNQLVTYYFQIHAKATAPVATDVPFLSFMMPAGTMLGIGADVLSDQGIDVTLGLGWAWSSTAGAFADAGTANLHSTVILYK